MKCSATVGLFLLLGSVTLAAQNASQTPNTYQPRKFEALTGQSANQVPNTYQPRKFDNTSNLSSSWVVLSIPGCPIRMQAHQGSGSGLMAVRGMERDIGIAQRIHLILSDPNAAQIVGARVTVRGFSAKGRTMRTLSNQGSASDLTRSLEITLSAESKKDVSADLVLAGFTSVTSIDLDSVTYANGSTWTFSGRDACQVAPDPMMLIAGR